LLLSSATLFFDFSSFAFPAVAFNSQATTTVMVIMVCGDGFKDVDEVCDKGNPPGTPADFGPSTCQDYGYTAGTLTCSSDCTQILTTMCNTCPNSIKEGGERCDGSDFGSSTCQTTTGLNSGYLLCTSGCQIDPAHCYSVGLPDPGSQGSSGGGGFGGGGSTGFNPGNNIPPSPTKVVIKGKAYPSSDVHILMDGKVIGIVKADARADFSFEISDVQAGVATFGFWAENKEGIKSTAFSLTFRIVDGAVTTISGAYLAPSISVDKDKVKKGEIVNIFGQTIPNADIYIYVNSASEIIKQIESDSIGAYLLPMDTEVLEDEEFHLAKSLFQISDGSSIIRSGFSNSVSFYVGSQGQSKKCAGADLNGDGRVNLTDFSILLYNWGTNNECSDQNHDGRVNLTDFSIMMYHWTG
jgi:hypothetical protein